MKRIEIVNSELQRQIATIIDRELTDPRIKSGMVSVTKVSTTPDLKFAKVYLSIFTGEDSDPKIAKDAFDAIKNAGGYIRNLMKDRVKIRVLPELVFAKDDSVNYGIKIDRIIAGLSKNDQD